MIVDDHRQGTAGWVGARLGIPTASNFSKIITGEGKVSKSADFYMRQLLAEYFIGEPCESGIGTLLMGRGTGLEPSARKWYEMERDVDVVQVGFCYRDDKLAGASPDGLVGEDGLVEIKCTSAPVHVEYLLGGIKGEYWPQCQGLLYVTGRAWVDLVAYNPVLPPVVKRIDPDEEYQAVLSAGVDTFIERMLVNRERLVRLGCVPSSRVLIPATMVTEDPW